jgi:hypothetical protein
MYWQAAAGEAAAINLTPLSTATMAVLLVLIFALGIFPQLALELLR